MKEILNKLLKRQEESDTRQREAEGAQRQNIIDQKEINKKQLENIKKDSEEKKRYAKSLKEAIKPNRLLGKNMEGKLLGASDGDKDIVDKNREMFSGVKGIGGTLKAAANRATALKMAGKTKGVLGYAKAFGKAITEVNVAKASEKINEQAQFMKKYGISDKDIYSGDSVVGRATGYMSEKLQDKKGLKGLFSGNYTEEERSGKKQKDRVKESKKDAKSGMTEKEREDVKARDTQTELLEQIVENTGGKRGGSGEEPEKGGGLLKGIGKGLGFLGKGIAGLGKGLGILAKSLGMGLAKGILALVPALAALAAPPVLLGLGALTLAFMGVGKALGYMAPFMEKLAPVIMETVKQIGTVLVEFVKGIPEMIVRIGGVITDLITTISGAITNFIDKIVESIERLGEVDAGNLLLLGPALISLSAGLLAFTGTKIVSGIGNLVEGFLGLIPGQKSTLEQLQELAALGPGLKQAGDGMKALAVGTGAISEPNDEVIEEVVAGAKEVVEADNPSETKAVRKGKRKMSQRRELINERRLNLRQQMKDLPPGEYEVRRGVVYDANTGEKIDTASTQINDADRNSSKSGGTNINAPTSTNISTQTSNNFIKPTSRNRDNTVSAYYKGNWALQSSASDW